MATYDEHWRDALAHRPSALQIITWNDFQEGSTIEPTTEYGFQYLDRIEEWVEQWSGRPSRLTDNEWPYRLYRLRRAAARVSDDTVRLERNRLLDTLSEDLMKDRHRWMGFRLWRLERKWGGDDADSKGAWE